MRTVIGLAFVVVAVAVAAPVPKGMKAKRPDAELFVGTWEIVQSDVNGKPRGGKATLWAFDADLNMTSFNQGAEPKNGTKWAIKLDPEKSPKQIDLIREGSNYKGIYEWDGDDLRIAYTLGGGRPATFDPKPDVYTELLRRVPEKK